jgi:hypothetical protein
MLSVIVIVIRAGIFFCIVVTGHYGKACPFALFIEERCDGGNLGI